LAGDQVDGAGRRWTELGGVAVVAHRVVLGVVPQRRDGVAVEVAHRQSLGGDRGRRRQRAAGGGAAGGGGPGRGAGHVAVGAGGLLGHGVGPLVGGRRLAGRQPERIGRIVAVVPGGEGGVAGRGGRVGIGVRVGGEQVHAEVPEAIIDVERREQVVVDR